jgi:transaldolase
MDQLSREIIEGNQLEKFIETCAMTGVTSNPAIFHTAMTHGNAYDAQLAELAATGMETEAIYEELAIRDIQMACDRLRPIYDRTDSADGYVSLEVSPKLANDTEGTYSAATSLHSRVNRPNVMIKIPGTPAGNPAIARCLEEGIPINVTLLFSLQAYESVARIYVDAMEKRAGEGQSLQVASVASFFVSRIDSLVDSWIEKQAENSDASARDTILQLRGLSAVNNAKLAYQSFLEIFADDRWSKLAEQGARVQRPLWASTSTKNKAYSDVLYVETLIGRDTVNTMPVNTIEAFSDHGTVTEDSVCDGVPEAQQYFENLEAAGVSFQKATDQLLEEGIEKFIEPYEKLLASLEAKRTAIRA